MSASKILIVEDDPHIAFGLEELLAGEGFCVRVCKRGDRAANDASDFGPDLIILDVMLPGANGFDVCKELRRKKSQALILMLTAKSQELDKVIGLDSGADDYVTKPFGVRELVARVHALLRRRTSGSAAQPGETFVIGRATINPKTMELSRQGKTEPLTARELKLLQLFFAAPGQVMSRDKLLNEVWGCNYYGTTRTLDQVIVQLRKKLGDSANRPKSLLTVHGVGYKLVLE